MERMGKARHNEARWREEASVEDTPEKYRKLLEEIKRLEGELDGHINDAIQIQEPTPEQHERGIRERREIFQRIEKTLAEKENLERAIRKEGRNPGDYLARQ